MKKIIINCGLIAGLIVTALMLAAMAGVISPDSYEGSLLLGYTTMLVAFSLIFVAVKNYRDNYGNGLISFGKALRIGLLITAIASTMYVIVWLIDYNYFLTDFFAKYSAHEMAQFKATGATQTQLHTKQLEMQNYAKMYKNPFYNAMFTYMEILPVGLIVSVLAAVILKRKQRVGEVALSS